MGTQVPRTAGLSPVGEQRHQPAPFADKGGRPEQRQCPHVRPWLLSSFPASPEANAPLPGWALPLSLHRIFLWS